MTSPLAVWEAVIAVARVLGLELRDAAQALEEFLALMRIEFVAVPPEAAALALDAFDRSGGAVIRRG